MREKKMVKMWVITAFISFGLKEVYADSWTTKADMPTPRYCLAIGVVNGKIYAIGGISDSGFISTNEEYDPLTNTWGTKASMPTARSELAIGVVNSKIYAIGGYIYNGNHIFFPTNEEYNPVTNMWDTTKAYIPNRRAGLAIGVVNNKIYAIGGYRLLSQIPIYFSTSQEYDPASDLWQTKTNMPTARAGLAIGVVNNKIYAIGGQNGSGYLSTNEEYDPATDSWTTKADMPTARAWLAIGVINTKVYAIGGNNGNSYLSTNEEYDPATDTWITKTNMPTVRGYLAIGVVNGRIYAIGGYSGYGNPLSTNEEYTPDVSVEENFSSLSSNRKRILRVYSNPASGKLSLFISSNKPGEKEIFISDITGRKGKIFKGFIPKGNYKLELNMKYKKGVYFIIFGEDKEKVVLY